MAESQDGLDDLQHKHKRTIIRNELLKDSILKDNKLSYEFS